MKKFLNWASKNILLVLFIVCTSAGLGGKHLWGESLTIGTKRIINIADEPSADPLTSVVTEYFMNNTIAALELSGGSTSGGMEVYNVKDYGAKAGVSIPVSGPDVTATNGDQYSAFMAAITAAPAGAIVFYGAGNWPVFQTINISSKQIYLIGTGNIYTNRHSFLNINSPGGQDRGHVIWITGKIIAQVNIPANSMATRAAGTAPKWNTFVGTGITIGINVNNSYVRVKWIEGFRRGLEILGGAGGGSQENTMEFLRLHYNAVGISLRNTTGNGWNDKNVLQGWGGGTGRITGGLAFEVDGFSSPAPNGENYNGAFRSNHIKFMAELVDSVWRINGDFTYNEINIIAVEGSATAGVLGTVNAFQCRSVLPNPVFHNKFKWGGVINANRLIYGMGLGGTIEGEVWVGSGTYVANKGRIDNAGLIILEVEPTVSLATRNSLPGNFRTVNMPIQKTYRTISQPTYTTVAADAEGYLKLDNSPMILTMGSASTNVGVTIHVKNINDDNATLFNVSGKATLEKDESVDITSNGSTWTAYSTGTP